MGCTELNSTFYRPHRPATYARWRDSTPSGFRFAVKVPRAITHDLALRRARVPFVDFLDQTAGLGEKRGPLLVQLPPSLFYEERVVSRFFDVVRAAYDGPLVCEPRHPTWFTEGATSSLDHYRVSRVAADPAVVPAAGVPGARSDLVYFRFHGSPRTYWSRYGADDVANLAATIRDLPSPTVVWCVFDNTAAGAALENACELRSLLKS
jgi:uncharacterized protein YecE (DUF72 family)